MVKINLISKSNVSLVYFWFIICIQGRLLCVCAPLVLVFVEVTWIQDMAGPVNSRSLCYLLYNLLRYDHYHYTALHYSVSFVSVFVRFKWDSL